MIKTRPLPYQFREKNTLTKIQAYYKYLTNVIFVSLSINLDAFGSDNNETETAEHCVMETKEFHLLLIQY